MKWDAVSRRHLLQGLGGFTLALPFLPSLAPRALAGVIPGKRFIGIGNSHGVYPEWWPSLSATQNLGQGVYAGDLTSVSGDLSPIFPNQHFGDLKSKILFLRGLDTCYAVNHCRQTPFSAGTHGGSANSSTMQIGSPSIDWVIGQSAVTYPSPPKVRNLVVSPDPLGRRDGGSYTFARTDNGTPVVAAVGNAQTAFDLAFKGELGTSDDPNSPKADDMKKVVDKVYEDYKRLRGSSRLGAADQLRLDDHLTHLSEVQKQLLASPAGAAASCSSPIPSPIRTTASVTEWDQAVKNHIDIVVAALACGSTKVAGIVFGPYFEAAYFGAKGYHEAVSHSTTNIEGHAKVQGAQARHIAYLIRKLDSITESDGRSLLYHSLVMWNNSLGKGSSHSSKELPLFMAGNGGGTFTTGRLLDYRYRPFYKGFITGNQYAGRPYNQLLVSILQAMGLQPQEYEQAGQPGFGVYDGPDVKPALDPYHAAYKTVEVKRAPLPGLRD